jgi:hypothetical protein
MKPKSWIAIVILVIFIVILIPTIMYNNMKTIPSRESGVFIDRVSAENNVSVEYCSFKSYSGSEVRPDQDTYYNVVLKFRNYRPPVYAEIIFPFNITIVDKSVYEQKSTTYDLNVYVHSNANATENISATEKTYYYPSEVVDGNKLRISYLDQNITYAMQVGVSANILKSESQDKSALKIFSINSNPLPFEMNGNLKSQGNVIVYTLRVLRNKYQIDLPESNFAPTITNDNSGDFNYEQIMWDSRNVPGEGDLYVIDVDKQDIKNKINFYGVLIIGTLLGILLTIGIELLIERKDS